MVHGHPISSHAFPQIVGGLNTFNFCVYELLVLIGQALFKNTLLGNLEESEMNLFIEFSFPHSIEAGTIINQGSYITLHLKSGKVEYAVDGSERNYHDGVDSLVNLHY